MSRLIDADALWMDVIRSMDYCDDILECIERQPTITEREMEWMPCSKGVPNENKYYLTTTVNDEVYCDRWIEDNFDRTELVIAWMPLPEPYKEGER